MNPHMWGQRLPTFVCIFELLAQRDKVLSTPMSQLRSSAENHYQLEQYEICIKGHLDPRWSHWFEGLAIALKDNGETLLSGPVVDQAALYGLLIKVRDLGLPLVSVMPTQPENLDKGE